MSKYGRQTFSTLKDNKLAPKKKLGQNFLVNQNTAEAIVRAGNVQSDQTIIEVGVGLGALTIPLANAAQKVIGFEIDSGIIRFHTQEKDLPENVTLIHQDILTADFVEIAKNYGAPIKFLANLPYSISNPFIFKLIDNHALIDTATIMLQKEVGDRLMAQPNSKNYGVPTVMLGCCAQVKKLMTLKPAEFHPRPKIDSVVLQIDFSKNLITPPEDTLEYDLKLLKTIVKTSFNQRRKTLQNSLGNANLFSQLVENDKSQNKKLTIQAIETAAIAPSTRPETLSVNDFVRLTCEVETLQKTSS